MTLAEKKKFRIQQTSAARRVRWARLSPEQKLAYSQKTNLRRYGLSIEDYSTLLEKQKQVCAICKGPPKTKHRLHVDHDHKTGRVRGLLCHLCNTALGNLRESPALLREAVNYLTRVE